MTIQIQYIVLFHNISLWEPLFEFSPFKKVDSSLFLIILWIYQDRQQHWENDGV